VPRQSGSRQPLETKDAAIDTFGLGFDNHPLPSFVYDEASLRFLAVNASAVRFYGYGRAQFLALTMADLESPEPAGVGGIGHHRKADGMTVAMRVDTSRVNLGGRAAILATAIDVTDLEQALLEGERRCRDVGDIAPHVEGEVAARLAQSRLSDAVAHVSQPFVIYDTEDHAVAFNQAFVDLHRMARTNTPVREGVPFRELAEWKLRHDFYVDAASGQKPDLEMLVARYQSGDEHAYRLRDGRSMLVTYRPLPGGNRVGLWTDITALKRAEEERRDLEGQLHHSQRLEALGTLAGGVAHELNNTLVPVIALTKRVAAKLPEGSRERANLETVMAASERARELVQEILTFSRKQQLRYEGLDLARIAEDALKMMRGALPATIYVETAIAPVPPLLGDPGQLHQMIVNLVTNSAQAIGAKHGTIKVVLGVDPGGAQILFSVSDTGCGMDEATLARIFEPFFTTKPVGQATGLGLAAVHGIVSSHGGHVDVSSEPGRGTRVQIAFPIETV
jgi:signal transduction histidine kinase